MRMILVKKVLVLILLATTFLVAARETSAACAEIRVVGMSPVQSALHTAEFVFVGDVDHVELLRDPLRQRVKFRVTQRFKGTVTDGQSYEYGYSGENVEFKMGQRVLVYAVNVRDVMSTACTRTRVVTVADKELEELQTLASRANAVAR